MPAVTQPPSFFPDIPPPFAHQFASTKFYSSHHRVLDFSDPGTGKTRSAIDALVAHRANGGKRALIFAPKAILAPSWGNDIKKFAPHLTYAIAAAPKREQAFRSDATVVITNHDAAKWVAEHAALLKDFDFLIIDEITAFKHRTSQRSKAMAQIARHFPNRAGLTGTPTANHLLDIWHQALLIDDGIALGTQFFKFRMAVCDPIQIGPGADMLDWVEKPGARDAVADALRYITIRHKFEDCLDIPEHTQRVVNFALSAKHRTAYDTLLHHSLLDLEDGTVDAIHAAALTTKLLQVAAGSVYDSAKHTALVDTERYDLVLQLIEEREQCVVAFNWKHQRDVLLELAKKNQLNYAVIDGETNEKELPKIVERFQAGEIKVIFAQPQSASHGLTLTKGTTTIWVSPTYDAERFLQFNRRIYRAGQTRKTETLMIAAENTIDEHVYDILTGKISSLTDMLAMLKTTTKKAA